jgi:hypothetical protein
MVSDIREAFEKFAEENGCHGDTDAWEDMGRDEIYRAGWLSALQSVEGATETAIKSSPTYRALYAEKQHLLGLLSAAAPSGDAKSVAIPPIPYSQHEKECGKLIDERDHAEDWADKLADAIGEYFGIDIGEHSDCNCPWETAFDSIPDNKNEVAIKAVELFKSELVKSVNPVFRPHIEGVCAVIADRLRQTDSDGGE